MSLDANNYQYPNDLLKDRVILITGASDGIGRALAVRAARLGARVILHGRSSAKLESVYDEIDAIDGALRPSIAVMDLATADSSAYTSLADSLDAEFGRVDGLVHNAGILGPRHAIAQYDAAEWQRVLHVNLTAPFALTQVCLPLLAKAPDPSLIFISSGVGRKGRAFWGTRVFAQELGPRLRVNCINPGPVRTAMRLAAYPAEDRDTLKTPDEVLPVYLYLLGPDSHGVTGQSLDAQ